MAKRKNSKSPKQVAALKHEDAKRKNIPTAELQSAAQRMEEMEPALPVTYKRNKPLPKGETRPCDRLLVSGVKPASEFFEDMRRSQSTLLVPAILYNDVIRLTADPGRVGI